MFLYLLFGLLVWFDFYAAGCYDLVYTFHFVVCFFPGPAWVVAVGAFVGFFIGEFWGWFGACFVGLIPVWTFWFWWFSFELGFGYCVYTYWLIVAVTVLGCGLGCLVLLLFCDFGGSLGLTCDSWVAFVCSSATGFCFAFGPFFIAMGGCLQFVAGGILICAVCWFGVNLGFVFDGCWSFDCLLSLGLYTAGFYTSSVLSGLLGLWVLFGFAVFLFWTLTSVLTLRFVWVCSFWFLELCLF